MKRGLLMAASALVAMSMNLAVHAAETDLLITETVNSNYSQYDRPVLVRQLLDLDRDYRGRLLKGLMAEVSGNAQVQVVINSRPLATFYVQSRVPATQRIDINRYIGDEIRTLQLEVVRGNLYLANLSARLDYVSTPPSDDPYLREELRRCEADRTRLENQVFEYQRYIENHCRNRRRPPGGGPVRPDR